MVKLIGILKLSAAGLIVLAVFFSIVQSIDTNDLGLTLVVSLVSLTIALVFCSYLVSTGFHDLRRTSPVQRWWILPGLVLFMFTCVATIYYAWKDLELYGSLIPFALVGLAISTFDLVGYVKTRSKVMLRGPWPEEPAVLPDREVKFTVQLTQGEWVRFVLMKTYDTPAFVWATFIAVIILIAALVFVFMEPAYPKSNIVLMIGFCGSVLVLIPFMTWKQAVRQFRKEVWVRDAVRYESTAGGLNATAPGKEIKLARGTFEVEQFKGWLIVKTGLHTGLYIPPRMMDGFSGSEIRAIILDRSGPDRRQ